MKKENLLITCSGGETSMFMCLWCMKYLKDKYNILVVFANTGVEHNNTLDFVKKCQEYYDIPVHWIEAVVHHGKRKGCTHKVADYETATRNTDWKVKDNTPFEEVIKKYGLPNHSRLHCTRELKMNPIKSFAKEYFKKLDFEQWVATNRKELIDLQENHENTKLYSEYKSLKRKVKYKIALGIRSDEFDRMNPKAKELGILYPLIQKDYKPMTKKQINFFWDLQPFRLELKGYEGNCLTCYKKSDNKLYQIAKENPEAFEFFDKMEQKYGNPNGKVPEKIWEEVLTDDGVSTHMVSRLEVLPKQEYKNTIFRNFRTARDIIEASKNFDGKVIDDHIEVESCEIFSSCGD